MMVACSRLEPAKCLIRLGKNKTLLSDDPAADLADPPTRDPSDFRTGLLPVTRHTSIARERWVPLKPRPDSAGLQVVLAPYWCSLHLEPIDECVRRQKPHDQPRTGAKPFEGSDR